MLLKRPFKAQKSDFKFEEDTSIVTAVDGPVVTVQTPKKSVVRHKKST